MGSLVDLLAQESCASLQQKTLQFVWHTKCTVCHAAANSRCACMRKYQSINHVLHNVLSRTLVVCTLCNCDEDAANIYQLCAFRC